MKIWKKSFTGQVRVYRGVLIAFLLAGAVIQSGAQPISRSINGGSSTVTFDPNIGLTGWTVNGVSQLNQELFYYNLNGGGVTQIINSSSPTTVTTGHNGPSPDLTADSNLGNLGVIDVNNSYTLSGGVNGNQFILTYMIVIQNNSATSQNISFYQYSDFDLAGVSGGQNVQLSTLSGGQYQAYQTGAGASLLDLLQPVGGVTTEWQADSSGAPFGALLGFPNPTTLANTPVIASGNVDFAYEWDAITLPAGQSFTISETQTITVPEPSSVALISSGMLALALVSRRRKSKKA
jgi:hypothetical protein